MCAKVCACLLIRWVILFPQSAPRRNYYHHHEYIIHTRLSHRSVGSQRQAFLSLRPRLEGYMWRPIRRAAKAPARLREPWHRTTAEQATAADRQRLHCFTPQAILSPCGRVETCAEPSKALLTWTSKDSSRVRRSQTAASLGRTFSPQSIGGMRFLGRYPRLVYQRAAGRQRDPTGGIRSHREELSCL